MSRSVGPEPDPRLSLEALEEQLRALPPAEVPADLSSKLVAGIQVSKATSSFGGAAARLWIWVGAVSVICVALSTGVYFTVDGSSSKVTRPASENGNPADSSSRKEADAASSKALADYEQAVRVDPFNADAWFALAKAQSDVQRSADAMASAQKAIDVARSRNRLDFAGNVEAWLRSYRGSQNKRSAK
jgi:hypothetical protein